MSKRVLSLILLALPAAWSACNLGCTLAACGVPVVITIQNSDGSTASGMEGEVKFGETTVPFKCEDGSTTTTGDVFVCLGGQLYLPITADEFEITIRSLDGQDTFQETVRPAYVQTRPNGPDCEPVCQQAETITVVVE